MPSGSRKRKSLKKPTPDEPPSSQGEPSELEAGLEEAMAKDGEEMTEGLPSRKLMDRGSEAIAEEGIEEGEKLTGETSREEKEVAKVEEASAAPDHPKIDTRGPPSQTERVPEVPIIFESEANGENEVEGETSDVPQEDPPPPIEDEKNAPPGESSPDIAPEAYKEEPTAEGIGAEICGEAQAGSEPRIDECPVELEWIAAMAQEDTVTEDDSTVDGVPAVGLDPAVDETPEYTRQEKDEAIAAVTDATSANIEPEGTDVAPVATAAETNDGPTSVQSDVDESVVETQPEEDAAAEILGMDPGLGAKMDKDSAEGEVEAAAPSANIEPEAKDYISPEIVAETDNGPTDVQSEREEEADQQQLEREAFPSPLEAGNDLDKEAGQVWKDAPSGEFDQEVESATPLIESQRDASQSEIEASTKVDSPESETGANPGEFKPEVDAAMDDTEKDEVVEAEIKSEMKATPIDAEQDEMAPVVTQPETVDMAFIEPEVEVENMLTSVKADPDALQEIEFEPERPLDALEEIEAVTKPTSQEVEEEADLNEGVETTVEADTEPASEVLTEASDEVIKEELNQGVETSPKADTEFYGETTRGYELEAEAAVPEAELEPDVEPSSGSKPDQEGSIETESGQQDLIEVAPDQPYIQDQDQQQERETDSGLEGPVTTALEGEVLAISDISVPASEPQTLEGGVASPPEEVVYDAADTEVVLDNDGAIYEQPNQMKESEGAEDVWDQEKAFSGEFQSSAVSSEQHPTITSHEIVLEEEPQAAKTESILNKQDSITDPRIMDVPSDVPEVVEQGLGTALPLDSEQTGNEYQPKDGVTFEQEQTPSGEMEKDLGEEEAALSTVAEAGSIGNDFDESAPDQLFLTDFPSSDQDGEVSESRGFDDTSARTSTLIEAGLTEEVDGEVRELDEPSSPRAPEQVGGKHADSGVEDIKVSLSTVRNSLKDEVEWKAVQDLEPPTDQEEGSPEFFKAEDPATTILESHIELPVDVRRSEESIVPDEEVDIVEENDGDEGTAPPTLGIVPALELLAVAKEELLQKILPSVTDGLRSLPSSETSAHDLSTRGGNQDNPVVNTKNSEIDNSGANDSEVVTSREVLIKTSNGSPVLYTSPAQDIEDVQAFRQQKIQEASLPVVPAQDVKQRSLQQGNFKGNEHPGTLQRRNNLLGCCGMFDLLLGKNK